jgi:hypothetical protein
MEIQFLMIIIYQIPLTIQPVFRAKNGEKYLLKNIVF